MKQHISSLMDGELDTHSSEQAIRDCGTEEGRQAWETYHLIGEAMRRDGTRSFDIADRVMKALAAEPAIIARPRPKPAQAFGRIALAAAASVATIGVVGWIGMQGMPGSGTPASGLAEGAGAAVTMQANVAVEPAKHQPEPTYAAIEVGDYLAAHRQLPEPDQYRAVAARAPARAR